MEKDDMERMVRLKAALESKKMRDGRGLLIRKLLERWEALSVKRQNAADHDSAKIIVSDAWIRKVIVQIQTAKDGHPLLKMEDEKELLRQKAVAEATNFKTFRDLEILNLFHVWQTELEKRMKRKQNLERDI